MAVNVADPIHYSLVIGDEHIPLNEEIGTVIKLTFMGKIFCLNCHKETAKSFGQGYCYNCFRKVPETSECIMRPELCQAHEGVARDMDWAKRNCLTQQLVYLAVSSHVKVGVTRLSQMPTRWIDQGASRAIIFARTPNRYLAGELEVFLKDYVSDRTSWQKMLKNEVDGTTDLYELKEELADQLPDDMADFYSPEEEEMTFTYPVTAFPDKVKSVSFDKEHVIEGFLVGIKGQYLIFSDGRVLNIRKHTGYQVELS
tara:strand:+ start:1771 stop:2538 length:768 start_codon:yes stop_codon:yes gene_type:complete